MVEKILSIEKEVPKIAPEKAPNFEQEKFSQKLIKRVPKILPITDEQKKRARLEKDDETIMIENTLSENINALYSQLNDSRKKMFRKRGEEVVLKIKTMLKGTRIRANEVFELIKNWLNLLPKINMYFLEQEAKIKTDKILEMKRKGQEIER